MFVTVRYAYHALKAMFFAVDAMLMPLRRCRYDALFMRHFFMMLYCLYASRYYAAAVC